MPWSRRLFLKAIGLSASGTALGLSTSSCNDSRQPEREPQTNGEANLTGSELARVVMFAAALFPPETENERRELDTTIRWWAHGRTTQGPHLQLYRDGLGVLTGRTTRDRDSAGKDDKAIDALKTELLEGIYSSSVGWKSLGYSAWPGVPSGSREYTTRPPSGVRVVGAPMAELFG